MLYERIRLGKKWRVLSAILQAEDEHDAGGQKAELAAE